MYISCSQQYRHKWPSPYKGHTNVICKLHCSTHCNYNHCRQSRKYVKKENAGDFTLRSSRITDKQSFYLLSVCLFTDLQVSGSLPSCQDRERASTAVRGIVIADSRSETGQKASENYRNETEVFCFQEVSARGEEDGLRYQRVSFQQYRKAGQLIWNSMYAQAHMRHRTDQLIWDRRKEAGDLSAETGGSSALTWDRRLVSFYLRQEAGQLLLRQEAGQL